MIDALDSKIQELAREASELSNVRSGLHQQLKEIDVRLTQISGAIVEFQKMKAQAQGDGSGDQTSDNRKSEVPGDPGQAKSEQDPS